MPRRLLPLAALLAVPSCRAADPAPAARAPPPAAIAPAAAAPANAAPAAVEPTALDDQARRRDAARVPLATAVVDAYANWNGFFSPLAANYSPDGKRFLFGSNRDGLPEIYLGEVGRPDAPPLAITAGPERALWAAFTRDGAAILYTRDRRGDENHAIWRVKPDGSDPVNLTPDPSVRRGIPLLPRSAPGVMFYDVSRTSDIRVELFRQAIAGGEAVKVYAQEAPGGALDVTGDGRRVLFAEARSSQDIAIHEVDTTTGAAHRVYPPPGVQAGFYAGRYSADGSRVLLATNDGDRVVLLALDAATGAERARFVNQELPTAPLALAPSPRNDWLAVRIDAGNHSQLKILDARTLRVRRAIDLPLADILLGAARPDGKAFTIAMSRPDQPPDVYAVDARTGAVSPLRADPRPGLAGLPPIDVAIDTARAFDGLSIPINRYLPKGAAGKRLPTVVIFHGGPATSYAVRWNHYTRFLVSLGYAVLEPNVRGSSGFGRSYEMADDREKRADWLKDVETVNTWTKQQPWCDPDRVIVWGQSYGGYTTLMALTRQPGLWRAGVDLYGPADLHEFLLSTDARIRAFFVAEFGDVEKDAALLDEFSPMRDVARIREPLFVYAGQHDPRVPRSESDAIVAAVRARGVPVEYMVAADEGHTVDRRDTKIELLTRTARFLEDAVK